MPKVSVRYTASGSAVKEDLILDGPAAQRTFTFDVDASDGLETRSGPDGTIEFVDEGRVRFKFARPFMYDAAGERSEAVSMDLDEGSDGSRLVLKADDQWLDSKERRWPVTVDPTTVIRSTDASGYYDWCTISSQHPPYSCSAGFTEDAATFHVGAETSSQKHRALLRFQLDSLPRGARIMSARLAAWRYCSSCQPIAIDVHRVTKSWSQWRATWSNSGFEPWGAPGGDFAAPASASTVLPAGEWHSWYPTGLVQSWVDGLAANHGVLLKARDESQIGPNAHFFTGDYGLGDTPYLEVQWEPPPPAYEPAIGEAPLFSFQSDKITDRSLLRVNLASGNLIYRQNDLAVAGTGLGLSVDRYYNSQSTNQDQLGHGWRLSLGQDVRLTEQAGDSVEVLFPSGFKGVFRKQWDGSYRPPLGVKADLEKGSGGAWTIAYRNSQTKFRFPAGGGKMTALEDKNGNKVSVGYAGSGKTASLTDTQDRTHSFSYGNLDFIEQLRDSSGRSASYTYNPATRDLVQTTDLAGKTTRYDYDSAHNLKEIIDPRGNRIVVTYDAQRRVRSVDHAGSITRYDYDTGSSVCSGLTDVKSTTVTDPNGHDTVYCWDRERRVVRSKRPLEDAVTSTFDIDSNEKQVGSAGALRSREFDDRSRLKSSRLPTGARSTNDYGDSVHPYFPTRVTNPQGNSLSLAYSANKLRSVEDSQANRQSFTYNADGTLETATDQRGVVTRYSYERGNLTGVNNPAPLGDERYTYDALSRVRTYTDGKDQTRTYDYDPLDRVVKITYQDGSSVSYTYDENGNRITRSDQTGSTTFMFYNPLNRLREERLPEPRTITYGYDPAGNLTSFDDGAGQVIYTFDEADRLKTVTEPGGQLFTMGYDGRGNRTSTAYPNGVSVTDTYDRSDRLTQTVARRAATALVDLSWEFTKGSSWNDTALRHKRTDAVAGSTTGYQYDHLDRLAGATTTGSRSDSRSYGYDPNSNRTSETINGQTTGSDYNDANQLTRRGSVTHGYDPNGNLTSTSDGYSFGYNPKDQTTSITPPGGGAQTMDYAGPTQTEMVRRGTTAYTNTLLGISREGQDHFTRDPQGLFLSQRTPSGRFYPIRDHIGSVVAVTDSNGNVVGRHDYDPFGREQGTPGFDSDLRFAGELHSSTLGLYKIGARWYHPSTGRWTQRDPSGQDPNPYTYAGANPINNVDPTGLFSLDINISVGPVETGFELTDDFDFNPYVGGGGGLGFGPSASLSFGESKSGPVGGGCVVACLNYGPKGGSVGVGPKAQAGIYYREYLGD